APTEILARQHWRNFSALLKKAGVEVGILVSDMPRRARDRTLNRLRKGKLKVVVGTHALIQEAVEFSRLGLVVIDEQHRFGVLQRAALKEKAKGIEPNVLVMTATPIPRSLALTIYGDLDLSVIDEMPEGRAPVVTRMFYDIERERLYRRVREHLERGERVFVVYPVIDESADGELLGATRMFEELNRVFDDFSVGLVHGRMKSEKKDRVMSRFAAGDVDMLVATTVIEVGIDVPEATVMVIEHADRFGLSQLHQLRGRVGRGEKGGYCFLVVPRDISEQAKKRLKILTETSDGFKISEEDLKLRGPGEFIGTRQSGVPQFRVANLIRDYELVLLAKKLAARLVERDRTLSEPQHALLKEAVMKRWGDYLKLADVG
ncbi:MAG TPA: DEAD/DEAH box helicase, partial [Proteobacteria bacterium]|nr:DEAD/DEAH box helicase [Pseudomonadota bacterium]